MTTQEMVQIALDLAGLKELPLDSSVSVGGEHVTRVLAGIDIGVAELLLAKELGYNCVVCHHNMVPGIGRFGDLVISDHYAKMVRYGVPVNQAQKLIAHRKQEIAQELHSANLDEVPSVARLLNIPYLGLHTPADLLGERFLETRISEIYTEKDNPTLQDFMDKFMTIREFSEAPKEQQPQIWVGGSDSYAGKFIVEFSGGVEPELDEYKALIDAGVGTFICMHMKNSICKALKEDNRCNVIVTGHMPSDSIGLNQILDAWEGHGLEITRIGGIV